MTRPDPAVESGISAAAGSQTRAGGRAVVVCYHFTADGAARPQHVARAFAELPFLESVVRIGSDYDHHQKRRAEPDGVVRLPVRPYRRNISLQRVWSYLDFARAVYAAPQLDDADVVCVCVPDYLAALAVLRLKRRRRFAVVVDVYDLWPEAFPLPPLANGFAKGLLKLGFPALRRWLLCQADLLFFQSEHFLRQFGGSHPRRIVLPMCQPGLATHLGGSCARPLAEEIRVLFLGSINSITDTDSLVTLLAALGERRPVVLGVVGGGAGRAELERRLAATKVRVVWRGVTFDRSIRDEELASAHFGFNGYKDTTEVSVSYKAIDYLQHGLPLLNRSKGDLTTLIEATGCGLNYDPAKIARTAEAILALTDEAHEAMRAAASRAFEENHSYEQFSATLRGGLEGLLAAPAGLNAPSEVGPGGATNRGRP